MRSVPCRNSLQVSGLTWHSEAGNSTQGTLKFCQFKSGLIHLCKLRVYVQAPGPPGSLAQRKPYSQSYCGLVASLPGTICYSYAAATGG